MLLGRIRTRVTWGGPRADGAIGFAGGHPRRPRWPFRPLPTIWATLRSWGKDERRAVFQAYNLSILALTVVLHAASGLLTPEVGKLAIVALPGTFGGAWLGAQAYRRLSDQRFHEVVLTLLGISGLTLVWTALSH